MISLFLIKSLWDNRSQRYYKEQGWIISIPVPFVICRLFKHQHDIVILIRRLYGIMENTPLSACAFERKRKGTRPFSLWNADTAFPIDQASTIVIVLIFCSFTGLSE